MLDFLILILLFLILNGVFGKINNIFLKLEQLKRNGEILDKFYKLLKYNLPIPEKISELTGITNQNVENGEHRENSILEFLLFIEGSILVSHDIQGDLKVLKVKLIVLDLK